MTEQEAKERSVDLFRVATPARNDAPIDEWRAGFEQMAAKLGLPDELAIEKLAVAGVPCIRVTAPGASADRLVIHFHSGGYVMGSATAYREFAGRLSAATGAPVLLVDYRLAPEHPYPAPIEDALAVYKAIIAETDPARIVLSGDSAGGGLCLATLLNIRDQGLPLPAGGVGICPLLDLAGEGDSADIPSDPLIGRDLIVGMGKVYIGDIDPHDHPLASPLWGKHQGLPPIYLCASASEALRDDSVRMAQSIEAAGGTVQLSLVEDYVHIWTFFPFLDAARTTLAEIGAFAQQCWAK
ncbi:MAG: alpha/beta hydrolase [Pseudomonadota bacterium]